MAAAVRRSKGGDAANTLSRHRFKAFHVQDFVLGPNRSEILSRQ